MPPCVEVEPQSETASFSAGGGEAGGRVSLTVFSFSPEHHCCVDLLRCSFDLILILCQSFHLLLGLLHHLPPAFHPIHAPFQGLVE